MKRGGGSSFKVTLKLFLEGLLLSHSIISFYSKVLALTPFISYRVSKHYMKCLLLRY